MSVKITSLLLDWNKKKAFKSIVLDEYELPTVKDAKLLYQEITDNFCFETHAGYNFINTYSKGIYLQNGAEYLEKIIKWEECPKNIKEKIRRSNYSITFPYRWRETLERIPYLIFIIDGTTGEDDYKRGMIGFTKGFIPEPD